MKRRRQRQFRPFACSPSRNKFGSGATAAVRQPFSESRMIIHLRSVATIPYEPMALYDQTCGPTALTGRCFKRLGFLLFNHANVPLFCHSIHQSISPSVHQPFNPSTLQSINPSIHQSCHYLPTNRPTSSFVICLSDKITSRSTALRSSRMLPVQLCCARADRASGVISLAG